MARGPRRQRPIDPEVAATVAPFGTDPAALLPILQILHDRDGGLTPLVLGDVAAALRLPPARVQGVAGFYTQLARPAHPGGTIAVCDGPACRLAGAPTLPADAADARPRQVRSSCLGLCDRAPAALVDGAPAGPLPPGAGPAAWPGVTGPSSTYAAPRPGETRVLLARVGAAPETLPPYDGLARALTLSPQAVIAEVTEAGLLGRGGAGFPAGRKWQMVAAAPAGPRYVVCNADESEPLAFKDRVLIDADPHQLLEGLAIAAYAVSAHEVVIYIRGEYAAQAARLESAIAAAAAAGRLNLPGPDGPAPLPVHVHRGAGAYICGEETALLESLEGKRGEPRARPPYPPVAGLHGAPTLLSNVETFAAVPAILAHGAAWYRALTGAATPGTKLYTLLGHVRRPGLFEAPFGLTLRRLIDEFGGGMRPGARFGFALAGGAAGMLVPPALLDVPLDYRSAAAGVPLGTGAFLICDESVAPVALLRDVLHFFAAESCGKCTPCRVGTAEARDILERLVSGAGRPGDVAALVGLADLLETASFCGLGQAAGPPIRSALAHFGPAFAAAEAGEGAP